METKLTMSLEELAETLGRSVTTLKQARSRRPASLPPAVRVPQSRGVLFLRKDVEAWLERYREPRADLAAESEQQEQQGLGIEFKIVSAGRMGKRGRGRPRKIRRGSSREGAE